MKIYFRAAALSLSLILLIGCATTDDERTPDLQNFQGRTIPSGSTDAATAAAKTY